MTDMRAIEQFLPTAEDTSAAAGRLAPVLRPGDCVLLSGSIGAGKTHFARALIQDWLAAADLWDEVPSPTYTLVQTYSNGRFDIWHADLYRLTSPAEIDELGLRDALADAALLIEWPDRLGDDVPEPALHLAFEEKNDGRLLSARGPARLVDALERAP